MVYSLFCAKSDMDETEDLIVSYGDIIFEPKLLEKLINSKADISVIIDKAWINLWNKRMDNPLEDAETLKLSKNNHIIEIGKKTDNYKDIQGQYIGLFKIAGNKIEAIKKEWEMMDKNQIYDGQKLQYIYMTSFLQHLISKGWNIKAVITENGWLEVDTEKDLKIYEAMEKENTLKQLYEIPKHFKI